MRDHRLYYGGRCCRGVAARCCSRYCGCHCATGCGAAGGGVRGAERYAQRARGGGLDDGGVVPLAVGAAQREPRARVLVPGQAPRLRDVRLAQLEVAAHAAARVGTERDERGGAAVGGRRRRRHRRAPRVARVAEHKVVDAERETMAELALRARVDVAVAAVVGVARVDRHRHQHARQRVVRVLLRSAQRRHRPRGRPRRELHKAEQRHGHAVALRKALPPVVDHRHELAAVRVGRVYVRLSLVPQEALDAVAAERERVHHAVVQGRERVRVACAAAAAAHVEARVAVDGPRGGVVRGGRRCRIALG
mmetsp:Transcript_26233/g.63768  ORF Transcript_26233/g.63768 Transcript_26233/m.63768 type:complete len:307 (-) Transcript_26233:579-1499(-)